MRFERGERFESKGIKDGRDDRKVSCRYVRRAEKERRGLWLTGWWDVDGDSGGREVSFAGELPPFRFGFLSLNLNNAATQITKHFNPPPIYQEMYQKHAYN